MIYHWLARVIEIYVVQFKIFTQVLQGTQCTLYVYDSPNAVSIPLAQVTEEDGDCNSTCSTFQCYFLLECSKEVNKKILANLIQSHAKYKEHQIKMISVNDVPLSVHFSNEEMSTGQKVEKYGVVLNHTAYLSVQLMSNYSLAEYTGIGCTYGGLLILEELESQQYVIRNRLCGLHTGAFRDEITLTMTGQNLIMAFYYYRGFGRILADIKIDISECAGLFVNRNADAVCQYPVLCNITSHHCHLFRHTVNISYPSKTCLQIQYIDDILHYINRTMFQIIISGFFNNVPMANRLDITHTNTSELSSHQWYRQHKRQTIMGYVLMYTIFGSSIRLIHLLQSRTDNSFVIKAHHISCVHNCSKLFEGFDHPELHFCDLCKTSYFFRLNRIKYYMFHVVINILLY